MLTSGEILQEYAKCLLSPAYVIETYFKTFDKTFNNSQGGFVPFNLFPRQREILQAYELYRNNLVTKPRQAGISTTTAAYYAVKAAFADENSPETIVILANKLKLAMEFLSKIKDFLTQVPRWVWGEEFYGTKEKEKKDFFSTNSKQELILPNGSKIVALATSKDALRGYTPTYLVIDEAAYIDDGEEVYGAAMSSLSTGGKITLVSTPNGYDPLYYKTYANAKSGDNDFHISEMHWYEDIRYSYDLKWLKGDEVIPEINFTFESYVIKIKEGYRPTSTWYEAMCRKMNNDKRMIAQELDVSFLGSGGNVIEEEVIKFHEDNNCKEPIFTDGIKKELWIWEKPIEGHRYLMGVDVSSGNGDDFSTFIIIDFTTMEEVVEYRGKIQPDLLAKIVKEYGELYNTYVVVDVTGGWGGTTVLKLLEMKYKNIHYSDKNKLLDNDKKLAKYILDGDKKPGLVVNSIRLPLIANLEQSIRENTIKIRSIRLISEMKTFVYRDGRPDHMKGHHDDLLMALGMGLWVLEHSFKNLEKVQNQTKAMLNSWVSSGQGEPVSEYNNGFTPRGSKGVAPKQKPRFSPQVAKNMQDPNGDFLWLFSGMK